MLFRHHVVVQFPMFAPMQALDIGRVIIVLIEIHMVPDAPPCFFIHATLKIPRISEMMCKYPRVGSRRLIELFIPYEIFFRAYVATRIKRHKRIACFHLWRLPRGATAQHKGMSRRTAISLATIQDAFRERGILTRYPWMPYLCDLDFILAGNRKRKIFFQIVSVHVSTPVTL